MNELKDIGVIDGFHTWEVIDTATGKVIGYNQTTADEEVFPTAPEV